MRIAQIAPLAERVPPAGYGGIELMVSRITDELIRRGHDVTLFASGDSETLAHLESVHPRALRLDPQVREWGIYEMLQLSHVYEQAGEFDIIHSHMGCATLPFASLVKTPTVHTLHGILTPDNRKLFTYHRKQFYISISDAQRDADLNYLRTVYNGIDLHDYSFQAQSQESPYLAFVGRISPEKGPQHAIEIAKKSGWKLKMAGKVDAVDREFYAQEILPLIDGEQIEYLGEVSHTQKVELLSHAAVTLFPITWREPFGLVMIESMATGTPVIGINMGSVPEVIAHGKTGFVCQSYEEMSQLIPAAFELDRKACRDHIEEYFSVRKMVDGYEDAYRQVVETRISNRNGHLVDPRLAV